MIIIIVIGIIIFVFFIINKIIIDLNPSLLRVQTNNL